LKCHAAQPEAVSKPPKRSLPQNTTADTLHIGILKGEYLARAARRGLPTVPPTVDQKGRYDLLRAAHISAVFAAGYLPM
jgi:hypothetical protein